MIQAIIRCGIFISPPNLSPLDSHHTLRVPCRGIIASRLDSERDECYCGWGGAERCWASLLKYIEETP